MVVNRLRSIPSWQVTLGVALLALGFLIAAQLAAEGPRVRYTSQERSPLVETARGLQAQQASLRAQILALRAQIQGLEEQGQGTTAIVVDLNNRLEQARIAAGLIPLSGTGVVLQLADSTRVVPPGANPSDYLVNGRDIRTVVAELWLAGAEAVAINSERVTASTAVVDIGASVLVNSAYIAAPYQISAIGPPDLFERLGSSQGWVDFIQTRRGTFGIDVRHAEPPLIDIPAFAGSVRLQESRLVATPAPAAP